MSDLRLIAISLLLFVSGALHGQSVTVADLEGAAASTADWLTYSRDYYGQRYVELDQITPANIDRLHPVWGVRDRRRESRPRGHSSDP